MVIHTYSIIIQNSKTLESFSQYRSLFAEILSRSRIGVCRWNESGTTIDTALPELHTLTDDKEEWRAIIVRFIDDNCMAAYESAPQNPYDFTVNQRQDKFKIRESEVPLIRLTQMLGGVPPLEVQFEPEVIKEEHRAPRTEYRPVVDEERDRAYQSLVQKYTFDGKMPSAILIVSLRKKVASVNETIGSTWISHKESESSEFWKRNQYPSICRFLVYDYETQGPIQKEADGFNFWFSVMLLSVNEIDSGTLQAYRLYTVNTVMNRSAMADSFQNMADRLRDAKYTINRDLRKDMEDQVGNEEPLPDYRVAVPVVLKLPGTEEREVRTRSFHLLSDGAMTDLAIWNRQRREVENDLAASVRLAERALDQTADRMRGSFSFDEEEVEPLNKYQEEDMRRETEILYHNIVGIQGTLPTDKMTSDERIMEVSKEVRSNLIGRVVKQAAINMFLIVILLSLFSVLPALVQFVNGAQGDIAALICVLPAGLAVIALCALFVLSVQKARLNTMIRKYNQCMKNALNKLVDNADDYSEYMGAIASHVRGSSYMNLSSRKKYFYSEEHNLKYKHIRAINALLGKLKNWSKAYHLEVDFTAKRPDTRVEMDTALPPAECRLYSFEAGESYSVGINNSGMTIQSPLSFASKIEILREELYDDECN